MYQIAGKDKRQDNFLKTSEELRNIIKPSSFTWESSKFPLFTREEEDTELSLSFSCEITTYHHIPPNQTTT